MPAPRKPGTFPPGHQGPRRTPGVPNRLGRELRLSIIDAAAAFGSDGKGTGGMCGYLFYLASEHPKAFAGLLGKLLPLQVSANVGATIAAVNVLSIPNDRFMTAEDFAKLRKPLIIESADPVN